MANNTDTTQFVTSNTDDEAEINEIDIQGSTNIFDIDSNRQLLSDCYGRYTQFWRVYTNMYVAYLGMDKALINANLGLYNDIIFSDVDAGNYNRSCLQDRYEHHIKTNYLKKFIDEETAFSVSIPVTYKSRSGDDDIIDTINTSLAHWSASTDSNLCKNMLIHSVAYELYYIDCDGEFCSRVISPRHAYAYTDSFCNVKLFMHIYRKGFELTQFVDIYTDSEIIHCDEQFNEVAPRQQHFFGQVPVAVATYTDDGWTDSLYNSIEGLQSSLERISNDMSEEIQEFRNAYMIAKNTQIDPDKADEMKKMGIINVRGDNADVSFLTKDINDTFLTNQQTFLMERIYELTNHVSNGEKTPSNTSSVAMKAKLIDTIQKVTLNQNGLLDAIKTRIKLLFVYLNFTEGTNYDWKDVEIIFTQNLPNDDLQAANICSLMQDKIPLETQLSLFSFIQNPQLSAKQAMEQQEQATVGSNLLDQARNNPNVDATTNNDANDTNGGDLSGEEG